MFHLGFGRVVTRIARRHIGSRRNVDMAPMAPPMVQFVFSSPGTVALQELASDGMAIAVTPWGMYMHRFKQGDGSSSAITGVRRIRKISWEFEDENLIKYRRLCKNGPAVSAMGSGRMGMSEFYGGRDNTASVATIHRALELRIVNLAKTTELESKL